MEICDIDDHDYLCWLLSNVDIKEPLKQSLIDHLECMGIIITEDMLYDSSTGEKKKTKFNNDKFKGDLKYLNPDVDMKKILKEVVDAGYKKMSTKYHPDKGGNKENMQALNDVKEWLYKGLGL